MKTATETFVELAGGWQQISHLFGIPHGLARVTCQTDWHRSGAESYLAILTVTGGDRDVSVALKAYVGGAGGGLEAGFAQLLDRRKMLCAVGIRTPRLYASGNATVAEEFIPHSATSRLLRAPNVRARAALVDQVLLLAERLDALGFRPVRLLSDLRVTESGDVVVCDFGADLGGARVGDPGAAWTRSLVGREFDALDKSVLRERSRGDLS